MSWLGAVVASKGEVEAVGPRKVVLLLHSVRAVDEGGGNGVASDRVNPRHHHACLELRGARRLYGDLHLGRARWDRHVHHMDGRPFPVVVARMEGGTGVGRAIEAHSQAHLVRHRRPERRSCVERLPHGLVNSAIADAPSENILFQSLVGCGGNDVCRTASMPDVGGVCRDRRAADAVPTGKGAIGEEGVQHQVVHHQGLVYHWEEQVRIGRANGLVKGVVEKFRVEL